MTEAAMTEKTTPATTDILAEIKAMNIFQRMAAITEELGVVAKNLSVAAGKSSYKAVSERDIIDAVKPIEAKYRVYSYPSDREILESDTLESEKKWNDNVTKTTTFFTRVRTVYTFVNIDNPDDRFTTIVFSEGIDPGDKGSGKAMTYADKYALMKAYKISTGDDPDQNPSEETKYNRTGAGQNRNQGQYQGQAQNQTRYQGQGQYTPPNQSQRQQGAGPVYSCKKCGHHLTDAKRPDGSIMIASELALYSSQRFGDILCADCQREAVANRGQK